MPCSYDKKKYKEFADKRDNRTLHYYKGHKIEGRSILDYMGKSLDDFTTEDIIKWKNYLDAKLPISKTFNADGKLIYIFYCINVNGECYVGHTTNFKQRIQAHKTNVNTQSNNLYRALYNYGFENADITILEQRCCKNLKDAIKHEQKHFDEIKASLNMCPPLHQTQPNPYHLS